MILGLLAATATVGSVELFTAGFSLGIATVIKLRRRDDGDKQYV